MSKGTILVVEDEFVTGSEIRARLSDMGYDVPEVVDNGAEAVQKAGALNPEIVVMDITLKGAMTGIEAAEEIRARFGIPVVFLTAHSDEATVERAVRSEPFGYLIKPLDERALKTTIQMALYKHAMEEKLRARNEEILRYVAALDGMDDLIIITDHTGLINYMNRASERLLGYPLTEVQGQHIGEFKDPESRFAIGKEAFFTDPKRIWTGNLVLKNRHGVKIAVSLKSTPIIKDNQMVGRAFVLRQQM